jgi:hypothetical protein
MCSYSLRVGCGEQQGRVSARQRGHLTVVAANAERYVDIFERFETD